MSVVVSEKLRSICDQLEIGIVPEQSYRRPMETYAVDTLEKILAEHGEGHLTLVLRSIVETDSNETELVAPTIQAVSDIILQHPEWADTGLKWLEALDTSGMKEMREVARGNLKAAPQRFAMATMLYLHLRKFFALAAAPKDSFVNERRSGV